MNRLLVVSPHPDDAAFSVGTTIEVLAQAAWQVRVQNIFSVSQYAPNLVPGASVAEVSETRAREDRAFAESIRGRIDIAHLNRLDAPLRGELVPGELQITRALEESERYEVSCVAADMRCLREVAEQGRLILLPLALGNHVDHLIAFEAARLAIDDNSCLGFYEDLPYAGDLSLAQIEQRVAAVASIFAVELMPILCGSGGRAQLRRKQELVSLYASQWVPSLLPAILLHARRLHGFERLWGTNGLAQALDFALGASGLACRGVGAMQIRMTVDDDAN